MAVFMHVLFPVLLIFASGFILQRIFHLDIKPIATLAIYLLLPMLVFDTFYTEPIDGSFFSIFLSAVLIMGVLIGLVVLIGRLVHLPATTINPLLLATVFPNSGNFGIPVILFAFGHKGLLYAMPMMIIHNVLMSTLGIYFAARGEGGLRVALRTVVIQPQNYAVILGILMARVHWLMPVGVLHSIRYLSQAAIPVVMLVLGMQLATVSLQKIKFGRIGLVLVIRLLISPLIAWTVCIVFQLNPLLTAVIVLLSAMPSAANTTIYAIQFNAQPKFVSSATFLTTTMSIITLSFLLNVFI